MKDYAKTFYRSKIWQKCRNDYFKYRNGLCEDCLAKGLYKPGVIVHHVIEISPQNITNPEITLNWNNLRLVCRECHAEEHGAHANKRYEIKPNGDVVLKL